MSAEEQLKSTAVGSWLVRDLVVFGWYDGPTDGLCAFDRPSCEVFFQMIDERYNEDGLDHRLYRLSEIPAGSVDEAQALYELFPKSDQSKQVAIRSRWAEIRANAHRTSLIVYSQNFRQFLGLYEYHDAEPPADWFGALGVELVPTEHLAPHS